MIHLPRVSIPPGPILGAIMMSGLAFTLIVVIVARSPYTHGNLRPKGYDRTEIAYLGEEHPFEGLGLADPGLASTGDPLQDGRLLFLKYGCASCHGFEGQGSTVGDDLGDASPSEIRRKVRDGPEGMPAYVSSYLSDEDLEKIVAFLTSSPEAAAGETSSAGLDPQGSGTLGGGFLHNLLVFLESIGTGPPGEAATAAPEGGTSQN